MDYLVLLEAQRERLNAEALGETDQYLGIVAIYKALGEAGIAAVAGWRRLIDEPGTSVDGRF